MDGRQFSALERGVSALTAMVCRVMDEEKGARQLKSERSIYEESALGKRDIHEEWRDNYRTPENEHFYRMAFAHIVDVFGPPEGSRIVDTGCGSCAKSRHLADLGYEVLGTDLSEEALLMATESLAGTEYESRITLRRENITDMTFDDGSVEYAVCWGVLMHVPDVKAAVSELCRVTRSGGKVAVSEGNFRSLQSVVLRGLKNLLGKERADVIQTPAGIEYWEVTDEGRLMTRQADIRWLITEFEKNGMSLVSHRAGQFSELYWVVSSSSLAELIHIFNRFWFKVVKRPRLAFGNILIFEKTTV